MNKITFEFHKSTFAQYEPDYVNMTIPEDMPQETKRQIMRLIIQKCMDVLSAR